MSTITEPYEKTFTPTNVTKEQVFHESDLSFRVRVKAKGKEKTVEFTVKAKGICVEVMLRPSGMDWLPEIRAHWQVQQVKRTCEILRGKFTHRPRNDPAFYDGEYPFVQTGDITAAGKYTRTYSQTLNDLGLSMSKMFPRGTMVMSIAAKIGPSPAAWRSHDGVHRESDRGCTATSSLLWSPCELRGLLLKTYAVVRQVGRIVPGTSK